ncbi:MAG: DUF1214 domain-containing protein [Hyphomicrobiaceae bacterium]
MLYFWKRFKTQIFSAFARATDWALFLVIVAVGGLGSSWYMVEAGTRLTTQRIGPWVAWKSQARIDADPYTRAHFARLGTLALSTETATTFLARTDTTGDHFDASCVYEISGQNPPAQWWSLTLFDQQGRLIANAADRYSFTADTVALSPDGTLKISMARDAHEGNWLPFGNANNFALVMHLLEPGVSLLDEEGEEEDEALTLPEIKKVSCR